jgi:hypothetical protein
VEKRRRAVNEMRLAMLQEKRGALTDEQVARYRWQGLLAQVEFESKV